MYFWTSPQANPAVDEVEPRPLDVLQAPGSTRALARGVALQTQIPLTLGNASGSANNGNAGADAGAAANVQKAASPDGTVSFVYDANEAIDVSDDLDTTPVEAALVTVEAMPTTPGDVLGVTLEIHYLDGRVLNQTFSAQVTEVATDKCTST